MSPTSRYTSIVLLKKKKKREVLLHKNTSLQMEEE